LASLLAPTPVVAQRLPAAAAERAPVVLPAQPASTGLPAPAVAVLASIVLPGAGQWLQGESRWVPYVALEVWSWLRFRQRRADSRRIAQQYRDLAWLVARRVSTGERRDTVFEYYEALTHYNASGAPVREGDPPETDTTTFNGNLWALSRALFFPEGKDFPPGSTEYMLAFGYYREHGIPGDYAWAWGGSTLEQQVFAELITDSDDAYRDGTRMLGLILANHVASTVDALITARLRALTSDRARLRTGLSPEGAGARLRSEVRISF